MYPNGSIYYTGTIAIKNRQNVTLSCNDIIAELKDGPLGVKQQSRNMINQSIIVHQIVLC